MKCLGQRGHWFGSAGTVSGCDDHEVPVGFRISAPALTFGDVASFAVVVDVEPTAGLSTVGQNPFGPDEGLREAEHECFQMFRIDR